MATVDGAGVVVVGIVAVVAAGETAAGVKVEYWGVAEGVAIRDGWDRGEVRPTVSLHRIPGGGAACAGLVSQSNRAVANGVPNTVAILVGERNMEVFLSRRHSGGPPGAVGEGTPALPPARV
jgi:hypothetical protein